MSKCPRAVRLDREDAMSADDILGLVIGLAALAVVIGYLSDVYFRAANFRWLDLPGLDEKKGRKQLL